jgi:hypothetical protein
LSSQQRERSPPLQTRLLNFGGEGVGGHHTILFEVIAIAIAQAIDPRAAVRAQSVVIDGGAIAVE